MRVKQNDQWFKNNGFEAIVTDGCFFRDLLFAAEYFVNKELLPEEIGLAYQYAIPDFMEDYRHPGQDRCFIKEHGHVQIIRIGFYIIGKRFVSIKYPYRADKDRMIIGTPADLYKCNFFISKCKIAKGNHFYVSDMYGNLSWNPGNSFTDNLLSVRGFTIKVFADGSTLRRD
jgi:hypothetical protein